MERQAQRERPAMRRRAAHGLSCDFHPRPEPAMTPLVVGVTSHRNIPAREIEPIRQRVRDFLARLRRDFPDLPLVVLSALAEGGDQLVAQEALAAGARLVAPLPLPRELYVEDFPDPAVRARFEALCNQAEVVQLPTLREHQPRHDIESAGLARDRQYAKAGVYIASHCHILLAIWDGRTSGQLGGTAQIVNYHLTSTLPGLIDRRRDTRHVLGVGDESLLYHIVCSRDRADGAPAAGLLPLQAGWRGTDGMASDDELPAEFRLMFAHMAGFNADCAKYADRIDTAPMPSHGIPSTATATIDRLFQAADWLAMHFQKRVLLAMRTTYTLAALMGIAFTFYAHLPAQDYLIYLFLLLFAGGGFVAVLAHRRGWHRKYLDYRALAEGLRIQSYWRRAGVSANIDHEFDHDNFLQKQNIELGWIRNVMRAAGVHASIDQEQPTTTALANVIAEWVGESGKSGQLHYYECKTVERTGVHHITETIGSISLWGGVTISVFLAAFALMLSPDTKIVLVMIMAVLSIVAAVREAYAYRKADKELIRQYRFMQRIFAGARAALDRTHDPVRQREILLSLGDAALTEHAEWTLMQRERQVEHSKM
jgi:CheY-like chemotaxis protein